MKRVQGNQTREDVRENNNKQMGYKAVVTLYIYTVIIEILHGNCVLDPLMWVIFEQKCVKLIIFYILQSLV